MWILEENPLKWCDLHEDGKKEFLLLLKILNIVSLGSFEKPYIYSPGMFSSKFNIHSSDECTLRWMVWHVNRYQIFINSLFFFSTAIEFAMKKTGEEEEMMNCVLALLHCSSVTVQRKSKNSTHPIKDRTNDQLYI